VAESHLDSVEIGAYRRRDVVDGGADVADLGRGVIDEDLDGASRLLPEEAKRISFSSRASVMKSS
jgi:hypothetical protein